MVYPFKFGIYQAVRVDIPSLFPTYKHNIRLQSGMSSEKHDGQYLNFKGLFAMEGKREKTS